MQYWEGAEQPTVLIINWCNKVACNTLEEKKYSKRETIWSECHGKCIYNYKETIWTDMWAWCIHQGSHSWEDYSCQVLLVDFGTRKVKNSEKAKYQCFWYGKDEKLKSRIASQKGSGIRVDNRFYSDNSNIVVIICDKKGGKGKENPLTFWQALTTWQVTGFNISYLNGQIDRLSTDERR